MQGHGRLVAPPSHASTQGPCVNGETTWSMALCIRSRILNLPLVCAPPRPVRLVVEYYGSAFAGYQSQSGCRTVQDALEVCVCVGWGRFAFETSHGVTHPRAPGPSLPTATSCPGGAGPLARRNGI